MQPAANFGTFEKGVQSLNITNLLPSNSVTDVLFSLTLVIPGETDGLGELLLLCCLLVL